MAKHSYTYCGTVIEAAGRVGGPHYGFLDVTDPHDTDGYHGPLTLESVDQVLDSGVMHSLPFALVDREKQCRLEADTMVDGWMMCGPCAVRAVANARNDPKTGRALSRVFA